MFDLLVECRPCGRRTDALRSGVASFVLHSAVIAGAVAATMQTTARPDDPDRAVPIVFRASRGPAEPPPPAGVLTNLAGLRIGFRVPDVSPIVPAVIPPPSTAPFDPQDFTGVGPGEGQWNGATDADTARRAPGAVFAARWVDVPPELLSHPPVSYPEILRQAGIGGRAVVEAVIDTTGRAERGSITVLSTTNPLFGQPAVVVVAASIYRPGKINGRAVRVRVQIPIDFQVAERGH